MQKVLLTNGNVFKRTDGRWCGVVWYRDEQGERKRKSEYFAVWNAPIRNKENGNSKQGTHQFETKNAPIRARNALSTM